MSQTESEPTTRQGWVVVIYADGPRHEERTNLGVMLFDANEVQYAARMDSLDRAVVRGDLPEWLALSIGDWIHRYPESWPDLRRVRATHESMEHARGRIKLSPIAPFARVKGVDDLSLLWKLYLEDWKQSNGGQDRPAD